MSVRQRPARPAIAAILASVAALSLSCGSGAGGQASAPVTAPPSSTVAGPTSPPTTPPGSPTPVPGGSTGGPEDGTWRIRLAMADGSYPLPVVLRDATGLVTGLVAPPPGQPTIDEGVVNTNGRPDSLTYAWTGGACDLVTELTFERFGEGFRLRVATERSGDICIMIGLGRAVVIELAAPVDAASVVLAPE